MEPVIRYAKALFFMIFNLFVRDFSYIWYYLKRGTYRKAWSFVWCRLLVRDVQGGLLDWFWGHPCDPMWIDQLSFAEINRVAPGLFNSAQGWNGFFRHPCEPDLLTTDLVHFRCIVTGTDICRC